MSNTTPAREHCWGCDRHIPLQPDGERHREHSGGPELCMRHAPMVVLLDRPVPCYRCLRPTRRGVLSSWPLPDHYAEHAECYARVKGIDAPNGWRWEEYAPTVAGLSSREEVANA